MDKQEKKPMPKKACMINLMFPVTEDKSALEIKAVIDEAIKNIPDKRFTFQIIET